MRFSFYQVYFKKATAKLQLKWADGEARKFGITNMNAEHANKILINNIPANSKQQFLKLLDKFGQIRIKKFIPYKNDPNKVFCLIKYTTKEQAIGAVKDLQNFNFQGNNLGCFFASQLLSQEFLTQNHQNKTQDFSQTQYMQQQQEQQKQSNIYYEFKDSSGQIYYFNPSQNKSQWEKPTEEDVQILPEEAYYNQDQKTTTNNYSTAQIFGKDNDNYVNVLARGIPDQWSSEDFLAFCQTYNANTVYTEVLNAENVKQANIQKRFETEKMGVIKFREIFEAENFVKKLNNQKLGNNMLSLEIVNQSIFIIYFFIFYIKILLIFTSNQV